MKLVSDLLQSIEGIGIWYIISLLIFFVMFLLILYWILRKPADEMKKIKNSILDDNEEN
jgi:cytochrome c oxidase cbb3-type subunit IV